MKKKKKEKVSENNGQLCFHGSRQDQKSVKTMTSFAFVSHHSWSTQATLAKKSVKTMASFASTEAAWSNFSFLSIPIPIEKKEEQKSVLTIVSTNAWTKILQKATDSILFWCDSTIRMTNFAKLNRLLFFLNDCN